MAKRLIEPISLVAKFERDLAAEDLNEVMKLLPKLSQLTPTNLATDRLQQFYIRALELTKRRDLKQNARILLNQLESQRALSQENSRKIGEIWLWLGEENKALEIADKSNDGELIRQIKIRAIDRTVIDPVSPSKKLLTDSQIAEIQTYHSAFALYEAGQFDESRERLNAIGMASPLMEWKLMLRGLIAYTMSEDSKALENWTRLKPDRAPAMMIAPLRICLEPSALANQSASDAKKLEPQSALLLGKLIVNLLKIKSSVSEYRQRDPLFNAAKEVAGELKTMSKGGFEKLANVFYWSVSKYGGPHELKNYEQIFGKPTLDPNFSRMRAVVAEKLDEPLTAFQSWSDYERWILRNPQFFPAKFLLQIRGTLQKKIARLAISAARGESPAINMLEMFGRVAAEKLKTQMILPSPEPALRSALELMPDDKEALMMMMDYLLDHQRPKDVLHIVATLDAKHGRDPEVLSKLAVYYLTIGDHDKLIDCVKREIEANPLDKGLRRRAGELLLTFARDFMASGDFSTARKKLEEIEASKFELEPFLRVSARALHGVMAAKENKKDEWSAIRQQLLSKELRIPSVIYLLGDGTKIKLPKKELDGILAIFKEILAGPPSVSEIALLINAFSHFESDPEPYRGLPSHRKLLHACLLDAAQKTTSPIDLERLCLVLHAAESHKLLKEVSQLGLRKFDANPYFWFYAAEAIQCPKDSPMVVRGAQRLYWTAHLRMKKSTDIDLKLFNELWEERVNMTPDLDALIREFSFGYGF